MKNKQGISFKDMEEKDYDYDNEELSEDEIPETADGVLRIQTCEVSSLKKKIKGKFERNILPLVEEIDKGNGLLFNEIDEFINNISENNSYSEMDYEMLNDLGKMITKSSNIDKEVEELKKLAKEISEQ